MRKLYCVADHIFSLECPEKWLSLLINYIPFEVADGEPIFTLTVSESPCPMRDETDDTLIFVDSSDDDMPRIEVYARSEYWRFAISKWKKSPICCQLCTDALFTQATLYISDSDARFAIDNGTMLLYAFRTAHLSTLELHASAVVKDGFAQLFLGHSGKGKSTHARMWQAAYPDAWLLNDDNPVLRLMSDGQVRVYGSPWSGKTPCYKAQSAPVRGIVKLSQAPQNQIHRLSHAEAYAYLLASASGLKIVPKMMDELHATIAQVVMTVPFFGLQCLPDTFAAVLCHQTLSTPDTTTL